MSGGRGVGITGPMSGGYNVTYPMMHMMYLPPPPHRMTDRFLWNIIFPKLHLGIQNTNTAQEHSDTFIQQLTASLLVAQSVPGSRSIARSQAKFVLWKEDASQPDVGTSTKPSATTQKDEKYCHF